MLRTVLAGALASGALLGGSAATAHDYGYPPGGYGSFGYGGYDSGTPAYASGGAGYGYAPYRPRGFTLLGARAGVTVLGIDVDASAKLKVGASGWSGGHRGYAPPPPALRAARAGGVRPARADVRAELRRQATARAMGRPIRR